jgi:hypothetical protein
MGFFDKSFLGKAKDVVTKGAGGIFNDEAREAMPLATSMNNPDGTVNRENMSKAQDNARAALDKAGSMSFLGKKFLAPDVLDGYKKMTEDAFQRQEVMMNMMDDYQKQKMTQQAAAEGNIVPPAVKPE